MALRSRYRGFLSFDAIFALLPILLIAAIAMGAAAHVAGEGKGTFERQRLFNRLLSAADYTVKSGAVFREGDVRFPNWIDAEMLTDDYAEDLRRREGLGFIYIGTATPPSEYGTCVFRIVAIGESKTIGRLFVCGG